MKPYRSLLGFDDEYLQILYAFDAGGPTTNESLAGNRTVRYELLCKACGNKSSRHKRELTQGSFCPVCRAKWHPIKGGKRWLELHPLTEPLTLLHIAGQITWYRGSIQAAILNLQKAIVDAWLASGGHYQVIDISASSVGQLEPLRTITEEQLEQAKTPPPPKITKRELPPVPEKVPHDIKDTGAKPISSELAAILAESMMHGQGTEAPNPVFKPPKGGMWALVPKSVYDAFQAQAMTMTKDDYTSWGLLTHDIVIHKGAETSLALESPPWVYAYEPLVDEVPDF